MLFQTARQWAEAERHYREAVRIYEGLGLSGNAALTWNQLATLNKEVGNPVAAEAWYRKAIAGGEQAGNDLTAARARANLSSLLSSLPGRLAEARQLAEETLVTMGRVDPEGSEIWKVYSILSEILDQQGLTAQAMECRKLARQTKRNFAGTRHEVRRHTTLILEIIGATQVPSQRDRLEQNWPAPEQNDWTKLLIAIRQIMAGERDADTLCERLDLEDSMIVEAILDGIRDPSTLQDLLSTEEATS
jgi:tetratricopeptide (TPR) repeat protein